MKHLGRSDKVWWEMLQQFDALERAGNEAVGAAPQAMLREEALAYFIQDNLGSAVLAAGADVVPAEWERSVRRSRDCTRRCGCAGRTV